MTGGILTQVNYTVGTLKGQSLNTGGHQTQVVLRAGSTVHLKSFCNCLCNVLL